MMALFYDKYIFDLRFNLPVPSLLERGWGEAFRGRRFF
jgi:hypothetical protein